MLRPLLRLLGWHPARCPECQERHVRAHAADGRVAFGCTNPRCGKQLFDDVAGLRPPRYETAPVHLSESGVNFVRPIDILNSQRGQEQIASTARALEQLRNEQRR